MPSALLSTLIWLPILGGLAVLALGDRRASMARWVALATAVLTLILSIPLYTGFDTTTADFQFVEQLPWIPAFNATYHLGVDGISLPLVLLTTFVTVPVIVAGWSVITERPAQYFAAFLIMEGLMVGVFSALDALLFYFFWEAMLIPMFLIIGIWGGPRRVYATIKFFLYTFLGSILTLSGVIYIAAAYAKGNGGQWSFDLAALAGFASTQLSNTEQYWVFILLMVGFAVKVPFFPVHTWLPLAHDQAPTAGSVILAGTLLKLGTYGVYRIALPSAPVGGVELNQFLAVLCIIGIVHAALICWVQHDVKKLIAYSSVSHLGFCMLGMFSLNSIGTTGSFMYMINHGLSTGAIFLCIGMIYERYHTKDMDQLGGLFRRMPVWSFFMIFFTMASLGLPGLNGFVGELLCLMGAFTAEPGSTSGYPGLLGPWYATVAALGLIAGAMYLLIMLGKLVWGPLREPSAHGSHGHDHGHAQAHGQAHASGEAALPRDLSLREVSILVPLAVACLVIGLYPKPMLEPIAKDVERSLSPYGALVRQHEAAGSLVWPEARDASGIARATTVGAPLKDIP